MTIDTRTEAAAREKLVNEIGNLIRSHGEHFPRSMLAKKVLSHVLTALETVTPEMVDAWRGDTALDTLPGWLEHTIDRWKVGLAASALTPTPTEMK